MLETHITHHTLWHALTGHPPPLHLLPISIQGATTDSREVVPGTLFAALPGDFTHGNRFVANALESGASAIVCSEEALKDVDTAYVPVAFCSEARLQWPRGHGPLSAGQCVCYVVPNAMEAIRLVGLFQRLHRTRTSIRIVGITGSIGKTSTKELAHSVLSQHFETYRTPGNFNGEHALPLVLMGLKYSHERLVTEMGMYRLGEIAEMCRLTQPQVGIVTNIGPSHLERLGTMEHIFEAKSELIRALPPASAGGVAILNWDDKRLRPMADLTQAHVYKVGLTPECDIWADRIESAGFKGIHFRLHLPMPQSRALHIRMPLLGRHSVHNALLATALGLSEGLPLQKILAGLRDTSNQVRLLLVEGINQSTLLDDTYNASEESCIAALNLLSDLAPERTGRRIAVLGDMLELGSSTEVSHVKVGRRAAQIADRLITIGELGSLIGQSALDVGMPENAVQILPDAASAVSLLKEEIGPDDLVLFKGSRAIGMDAVVADVSVPAGQ